MADFSLCPGAAHTALSAATKGSVFIGPHSCKWHREIRRLSYVSIAAAEHDSQGNL